MHKKEKKRYLGRIKWKEGKYRKRYKKGTTGENKNRKKQKPGGENERKRHIKRDNKRKENWTETDNWRGKERKR